MNPGNSGGPAVNLRGHLLGLATFGLRDAQGINFAVATETIQTFLGTPGSVDDGTLDPATEQAIKNAIVAYSHAEADARNHFDPAPIVPRATAAIVSAVSRQIQDSSVLALDTGLRVEYRVAEARFGAIRRACDGRITAELVEAWSHHVTRWSKIVSDETRETSQTVAMVFSDGAWKLDGVRFEGGKAVGNPPNR
jgi:Trypsin